MKNNIQDLEEKLIVGTKVKIGKKYAEEFGFEKDEIIELIEGYFDYDNGLYTETQTVPSRWDEEVKEFDSIYHLFGNDLEYFYDCEILDNNDM